MGDCKLWSLSGAGRGAELLEVRDTQNTPPWEHNDKGK